MEGTGMRVLSPLISIVDRLWSTPVARAVHVPAGRVVVSVSDKRIWARVPERVLLRD
jgi:hypothetical protein